MRITTGTDILKISRLFPGSPRVDWNDSFIKKTFTDRERSQGKEREGERDRAAYLAVRFAGKEAIFKALSGCGLGFTPQDIEVIDGICGRPEIEIRGKTKEALESFLEKHGERLSLDVSLSFEDEYAIASAAVLFEPRSVL